MKRIVLQLAAICLCLAAGAAWADDNAEMTLTGTGAVSVSPDMATIRLGVIAEELTAERAIAEVNETAATILATLDGAGVARADIQTTAFTVLPVQANRNGGQEARITGFVVTNEVQVRVRDLDALGPVLDAVARDGANSFRDLRFGLADPAIHLAAARRAAMADAVAQATLYAEAAGVEIVRVIRISDAAGAGPPRPFMAETALVDAGAIAQGEVTLEASVTVTWEIAAP